MANNGWKFKQAMGYSQRLFSQFLQHNGVTNTCVLCNYPSEQLDNLLCAVCLQDLDRFELGYDYLLQNPKGAASLECKNIAGLALVSEYHWPFSQFVPSLKFHQGVIHAKWFGQLLEQQVYHQVWSSIDVVIPIPLHPIRQFQRGYNQSQLIAQHMVKYFKKINLQILHRQLSTRPQTKLNKGQRRKNMANAFVCDGELNGLTVLIVDDVITTGSTVNQAAKVLLEKGATAVYVAAVAISSLS